jgi:3-hydroxyisobutyrate dehydrogenase
MLGEAVSLHLLKSGYSLTVYNRTKSKTENLRQKGAVISDHPKHVSESSDLIITCVKDADAVNQVLFGHDGIIYGKHSNMTVADMSTINPTSAKNISKKLHDAEIKSLEIPVMGGPNVAIDGKLVLMASGDRKVFDEYKEVFDTIANKTFFLGKSGSAHSIKLAMNLQISLLAISLAEGITLTRKAGYKPTFTLKNLKKDLDIINAAAKDFGAILPIAERANEIYREAEEAGFGEIDYTGILEYIKKLSRD